MYIKFLLCKKHVYILNFKLKTHIAHVVCMRACLQSLDWNIDWYCGMDYRMDKLIHSFAVHAAFTC